MILQKIVTLLLLLTSISLQSSELRTISVQDEHQNPNVQRRFEHAIGKSDLNALTNLISSHSNVVNKNRSSLLKAVKESDLKVVSLLVNNLDSSHINKRYTLNKITLLMGAIYRVKPQILEIVELLINNDNQDVNTKDKHRNSALHMVIQRRINVSALREQHAHFLPHAESILALLLAVPNIKVNEKGEGSQKPLELALGGWDEGVRQLTRHPKIVLTDIQDYYWNSATPESQEIVRGELTTTITKGSTLLPEIAQQVTSFWLT